MKFTLPPLPYALNALEPYMDARTLEVHHDKHHGTYVAKLNDALSRASELQDKSIEYLLSNLDAIPESIRTAIQNNGGGHYNHTLFWDMLQNNRSEIPPAEVKNLIAESFGSWEKFRNDFSETATKLFGSGWTWLVRDPKDHTLKIVTTPNQESPLSQGLHPLLGIDIWEHAYYLQYQNRRAEYIEAWWNLINWDRLVESLKNHKA